jgi:hypothetical protein
LVHHLSCVLFASVEVAGPGDVILTEGIVETPRHDWGIRGRAGNELILTYDVAR